MTRFQRWSVRKLRRRPRSRDKTDAQNRAKSQTLLSVKEALNSTSSDDGDETSIGSVNSVGICGKAVDQNSLSSEDSPNLDARNRSKFYGEIAKKSKNNLECEDAEPKTETVEDANSKSNLSDKSSNSSSSEGTNGTKEDSGGVLMFGCDLPQPTIDGCLELSSDQDSTAGEDEEFADEEDIENLHPEMLLYKAAAAHNLPVMSAALASGADKLWANLNDKGRSALHQAIVSVSIFEQ